MKLSYYALFGVQAVMAAFSINAFAAKEVASGVIHFHGEIVESPCDVNNTSNNINVTCLRDGRTRTFHRALNTPREHEITSDLFEKTSLEYLNPERTLGVYTIQYR